MAQQPGAAQAQPAQTAAKPATHQASDLDPIARFHTLVPVLQEKLMTLIKTSAAVFHQNAQADACVKSSESAPQQVEKCLEDFYSICDQIELHLRSAIECSAQNSDSSKNTPIPVQGRLGISEQNAEGQSYPQYLATVRSQVSCAKEIHDLLRECASRLGTSQMAMTNIAPGAGPPGTMNPMGPGPGPGPGPVPGQQPPQGQGMHPMAPMNPMQMGKMGQP